MKVVSEVQGTLQSEEGFTLMEVLVAIAILAVALLGTASMLFNGLATSAGSNNRYIATATIQSQVESLLKSSFAGLTSQLTPVQTTSNGVTYNTKWRVTTLSTNSVFINISTTWTDKIGSHGMGFQLVRSR
ncbi:prepilin-type N-terminal cleavage/methylation domain-containing protein [Geobacter sp.]|uniref:type IV pilus modification PilV family protein n=1 Tax=Geobacter sp. TaxID=46610 RepID=UPI002620F0DE|nr:prepilin-type N-terminal cleavage/methylation domain-containing protein [Geobacter sp.]